MKKFTKPMLLMLCLMLTLTGCINGKNGEDNTKDSLEAYIQSGENTKYVYDGQGSEYAGFESWVDYKSDGSLQLRVNNSGTEAVSVYKVEAGKLIVSFRQAETYHRENFLSSQSNSNEVILMEPIQKGTAWTLESGEERSITDVDVEVATPSGTYKAVEVTTKYTDSTTKEYYVKGIGLVKSIFIGSDGFEVTSSLSSVEKDAKVKHEILMYYPNVEQDKYFYKEATLEFLTNDEPEAIIEKAYKENKPENVDSVLSENSSLNKFSFEPSTGIVKLDMNKSFLDEMEGSSYESMILQCLSATFGGYCYSDKLTITIDGKPYESGHVLLDQDNYIQTQIDQEVTEVK